MRPKITKVTVEFIEVGTYYVKATFIPLPDDPAYEVGRVAYALEENGEQIDSGVVNNGPMEEILEEIQGLAGFALRER